jgi:hypothetical protein
MSDPFFCDLNDTQIADLIERLRQENSVWNNLIQLLEAITASYPSPKDASLHVAVDGHEKKRRGHLSVVRSSRDIDTTLPGQGKQSATDPPSALRS